MMKWLRGSTRETKIRQALSALVVKLALEEKAQKNVNKELDRDERDEYTKQDFRVNERNDF